MAKSQDASSLSNAVRVVRKASKARLEKKLAADPSAVLNTAEVRLLNRALQRALVTSFPSLPPDILDRADDTIRWHARGVRCAQARGARGIRDLAFALQIPQYRLRAIESGRLSEFRLDYARRYFRFSRSSTGFYGCSAPLACAK